MDLKQKIQFTVNGIEHKVDISTIDSSITLNTFIRSKIHLTGTKRMCLEGGCGVCIVAIERKNTIEAANSCLIPLVACHGWKIETIEGLTNPSSPQQYHFLQTILAKFNGSQCGFCSPGMVMNMYSLMQNNPNLTMHQVENSFAGNICRCTGYRPILAAFKSICKDATPDLTQQITDIEDIQICRKQCSSPCQIVNPYYFNFGSSTWIKIFKLKDLLLIMQTIEDCALIAGNTSKGVYKNMNDSKVYIDISRVEELVSFNLKTNLVLGANITLADAMKLFTYIAEKDTNFSYLLKIRKHFDLIANVAIRNLGTLAGNLMIKHHHPEFPSDIFVCFEAIGAALLIVDLKGQKVTIPLRELLKISMKGKIIEAIILPPLSSDYKFESYKIMQRAQNAHALLNAAFLLKLDKSHTIKSAQIVYGCINPTFTHATKTEKLLLQKSLLNNATIHQTLQSLDLELDPDHIPPDPSPGFRKKLAISLFYKFILSIAPQKLLSPRNYSGSLRLERPVSSGTQSFPSEAKPKAIPKIEALVQTSGQAKYILDMPDLPEQLFGAFVLAKAKALSIIQKIHTTEALNLKGVVAFIDKSDIPGENSFTPTLMNFGVQEEIFCSGEVQYFHQPVGVIVAKSQEIAEKGAELVRITYKPGKEPLLTIGAILCSREKNRIREEVQIGVKEEVVQSEIKKIVKGTVELSWQYHYHMETQSCNVVPTEDGFDLYPSSQWLDLSQNSAAAAVNIPTNRINVFIRRLGGGFGAKLSRNSLVSCAAVIAANKVRKPVKIWMPFETNMNVMGKRYPVYCEYEVGIDEDGVIQYHKNRFYSDYGKGGNEPNISYVLDVLLSTYKTEKWDLKAFSVHSDNHASCFIRAPGTCEGMAIIESIMEHVAFSLKMDPLEFRIKNMNTDSNHLLLKFINDLKQWANIDARKEQIAKFNTVNRWRKKGLSVIPMTYPLHLFGNYGVIVSIYHADGTVSIAHGGIEMGQGINTKVAQVCSSKLGIPIEKISIKPSNNLIAPNAHMSGGSLTSESVCHGIIKACDILLERIAPIRTSLEGYTWEELIKQCHKEYINLSATAMSSPKEPDLQNYSVYGVCATEIELDVLTGEHIILRVDLVEDAGSSMNPNIDIGQIEGAFVMGIGYFTTEEIIFDGNGKLLTNRTWNYKPPGVKDIPVDFRIKLPSHTTNSVGVLNSKGFIVLYKNKIV